MAYAVRNQCYIAAICDKNSQVFVKIGETSNICRRISQLIKKASSIYYHYDDIKGDLNERRFVESYLRIKMNSIDGLVQISDDYFSATSLEFAEAIVDNYAEDWINKAKKLLENL